MWTLHLRPSLPALLASCTKRCSRDTWLVLLAAWDDLAGHCRALLVELLHRTPSHTRISCAVPTHCLPCHQSISCGAGSCPHSLEPLVAPLFRGAQCPLAAPCQAPVTTSLGWWACEQ